MQVEINIVKHIWMDIPSRPSSPLGFWLCMASVSAARSGMHSEKYWMILSIQTALDMLYTLYFKTLLTMGCFNVADAIILSTA